TQRTAAPAAIRMPTPITSTASQVRSGEGKASAAKASSAVPPARNAKDVRTHARKVRSLARVKRGSGSLPCGSSQREIRLRSGSDMTLLGVRRCYEHTQPVIGETYLAG